jgi:galactokinase
LRDITADGLDAALDRLDDDVLRRRTRHVVTENDRVLTTVQYLRDGRLAEIGPLLTASHVSLRDDFEVSAPELDAAVDAALAAGALGARMTGGGFGGCVIALAPAERAEAVRAAVRSAVQAAGYAEPVITLTRAAHGAGLVTSAP